MSSRKTIYLRFNAAGELLSPGGGKADRENWPVLELGETLSVECSFFNVELTDGQYQLTPRVWEEYLPLQLVGYAAHTGSVIFFSQSLDSKVTRTGSYNADNSRNFCRYATCRADISTNTIPFATALRDSRAKEFHLFVLGYPGGSAAPTVLGSCRFNGCDRKDLPVAVLAEVADDAVLRNFAATRSRSTPITYYSTDPDDTWRSYTSGEDRYFRRRFLSGPLSAPVTIPQQGFQADTFGLRAERDTLVPSPAEPACYFATDEQCYYVYSDGRWSDGICLAGEAATVVREYRQLPFELMVDDSQYGTVIQLDELLPEARCLVELPGIQSVKIRLLSANSTVTGKAVLALQAGEVTTEPQTVPVTAAGVWQTLSVPEGGLDGALTLCRLVEADADTLRDNETVSVLITDVAVLASGTARNSPGIPASNPILAASTAGHPIWLSPLRPNVPGAPWPSAVPRNFATEPETWHDFGAWARENIATADDLKIEMEFYWNEASGMLVRNIFSSSAASTPFAISTQATGRMLISTNLGSRYGNYSNITADWDAAIGWHTCEATIVGSTLSAIIDNGTPNSVATGDRNQSLTIGAPTSSFNGFIRKLKVTNLITGATWSYPSFAERTRLLTLSNIRSDREYFEGAASGVVRRIKTQLDLRGNATSKTFVCRCFIPSHAADGKLYVSGLVTQGAYTSGGSSYVLDIDVRENFTGTTPQIGINCRYQGVTGQRECYIDAASLPIFDRWFTLAAVFNYPAGTISIYLDGAEIGKKTVVMEPFGQGAGSSLSDAVSIMHDATTAYISDHRIAWAHVYDYAMTESEIRLLSPPADPVKKWIIPCAAGQVNIQTVGFENLEWTFPDGSTSNAATINREVTAGLLVCRYTGLSAESLLQINNSSALNNSLMHARELPRVCKNLLLYYLSGLTGDIAELPRIVYDLTLYSITGLTGKTADLPKAAHALTLRYLPGLVGDILTLPKPTEVLSLYNLPGVTGAVAGLPTVTKVRQIMYLPGITGALPVMSTNTSVSFSNNAAVTPAEYDQTIQNIVDAGSLNGTLTISKNRTSASDANIQILRDRGWTVIEA